MDAKELLTACRQIDPTKSYLARADHWHHNRRTVPDDPEYCLSVVDKQFQCVQYHGHSFAACLAQFEAAQLTSTASGKDALHP